MTTTAPLIEVALYLRGDRLEPEAISRLIGMSPSREFRKGQLHGKNDRFSAPVGLWVYSIKIDSIGVAEYVDQLIAKFAAIGICLSDLDGVEDAFVDILICRDNISGQVESTSVELTREQIKELGKLGLGVQVTVMQ